MTKRATSVIEAMVIMLIIVTWVVWMYKIYIESIRLSDVTAQRIQAIQIAREWLEAMENIRNTNWILYWADYENCWNVIDYNNQCIGWDPTWAIPVTDITEWSYIIYQNDDLRWQLLPKTDPSTNFAAYIQEFEVGKIDNFYTQTGSTTENTSLKPKFTREIKISYETNSNDPKMYIESLVQWKWRKETPHKVSLDLELTNWKNKN